MDGTREAVIGFNIWVRPRQVIHKLIHTVSAGFSTLSWSLANSLAARAFVRARDKYGYFTDANCEGFVMWMRGQLYSGGG